MHGIIQYLPSISSSHGCYASHRVGQRLFRAHEDNNLIEHEERKHRSCCNERGVGWTHWECPAPHIDEHHRQNRAARAMANGNVLASAGVLTLLPYVHMRQLMNEGAVTASSSTTNCQWWICVGLPAYYSETLTEASKQWYVDGRNCCSCNIRIRCASNLVPLHGKRCKALCAHFISNKAALNYTLTHHAVLNQCGVRYPLRLVCLLFKFQPRWISQVDAYSAKCLTNSHSPLSIVGYCVLKW